MEEQHLRVGNRAVEEPVRMMLLDAIFTDAPASVPATPPSVRNVTFSSASPDLIFLYNVVVKISSITLSELAICA